MSMLMPRFCKSRIWPLLDITVKSEPKNLPIVSALCGDSTIINFFINV